MGAREPLESHKLLIACALSPFNVLAGADVTVCGQQAQIRGRAARTEALRTPDATRPSGALLHAHFTLCSAVCEARC
eukprot:1249958-Rhodomonas_salina.2